MSRLIRPDLEICGMFHIEEFEAKILANYWCSGKLHNFEINSFSRGNHSASYRVEYNLNS